MTAPDAASRRIELVVRDLGRMRYAPAFDLQREAVREVIAARENSSVSSHPMFLLLVEHDPPVITISRRPAASRHLIATESQLRAAGVEVAQTDRGGDITYHGPGQLVVYPILDLNVLGLRLHSYMRLLEQIVIDVLARFGLRGERDPSATGVWIRSAGPAQIDEPAAAPPSKLCAMGVRITRWVTMHGLALNVDTNMEHFNLIVPCGLAGRSVTSMRRELGGDCPTMGEVKQTLIDRFREAVGSCSVRQY